MVVSSGIAKTNGHPPRFSRGNRVSPSPRHSPVGNGSCRTKNRRVANRCTAMQAFFMTVDAYLITGGAGAVGSNIADQLVRAGAEEMVVLDNFVRGRRENLEWAVANGPVRLVVGDVRDRELVTELTRGHGRGLPPGRAAHHPVRGGAAARAGSDGGRDLQRDRGGALARGCAGWSRLPPPRCTGSRRHSRPASPTTPTPTTRSTAPPRRSTRGCCAASTRCAGSITWRCGTSTCTARAWTSTASTPRCWCGGWSGSRPAQPPLILGDGSQTMDFVYIERRRARQPARRGRRRERRGVQRRQRDRDEPAWSWPTLLIAVMGSDLPVEFGPERGVNKVPRRLADTSARARAARLRGRGRTSKRACAGWSSWWRARTAGVSPGGARALAASP